MFGLTSLFISPAFADAAQGMPPAEDLPSMLMRYLPVALILVVFYFLLIRPQQKKIDETNALIAALKKGDRVVILGGLVGTISKIEGDDYLMIDIAQGVSMKVLRSAVTSLDTPQDKMKDSKKA